MPSKAVRLSDSSAPNAPKPESLMSRDSDSVDNSGTDAPMYTIPIDKRPPHGPLFSKIFFPILFNIGQIGILTAVLMTVPLLLIPVVGKKWFEAIVAWAKDGYGRLLIAITVLFAPTSLVITTNAPPELTNLVERDSEGRMTKINLPDRLVIMANHQAYTDWMYLWIIACYAGHSRGIIILLKDTLKHIPIVGWGMQFFKFIFLKRSWASDRENLTKALKNLSDHAKGTDIAPSGSEDGNEESSLLDKSRPTSTTRSRRSPLWLLIFPEGTITSDEERVKSKRYAEREGIDDLKSTLHPRSTGLLFILRTLLPSLPDLQLLDITIGYPGVPFGKYPQEWYGLVSVFFRSVPPPTVHLHLHLHGDLIKGEGVSGIPSLITPPEVSREGDEEQVKPDTGLASPEEARSFELWLRGKWLEKEDMMEKFSRDQRFTNPTDDDGEGREVVKIRQVRWYDWIGSVGGGGIMTVGLVIAIWRIVVAKE